VAISSIAPKILRGVRGFRKAACAMSMWPAGAAAKWRDLLVRDAAMNIATRCRIALRWPIAPALGTAVLLFLALAPESASAIPLFNRQTGQNCVACHAGGQFPELTNYGRLFKMTGYTLGVRTVPVSMMALGSLSKVASTSKSDDPGADFQKNDKPIFATASLFLGGKITDNIGAFTQFTWDPYAITTDSGKFKGAFGADNMDIRYADRFVDENRDVIFGISANNNPSITDPWNTAAAWMQYVPVPSPTSSQFIDGASPYPGLSSGGNVAGLSAYAFVNQLLYVEAGDYRTAKGLFSIFKAGLKNGDVTKLRGNNPYARIALSRNWGAHSLMLGATHMTARVYDDPLDTSDPSTVHRFRDEIVDAQYQYLLDPHTVTVQLVFTHNHHTYPAGQSGQSVPFVDSQGNALPLTSGTDRTNLVRAKFSYVYQARYGGSFSYFDLSGSTNTANQTSGIDPATMTITAIPDAAAPSTRVNGSLSGNPATRGATAEAFWMPMQNLRVGLQYTAYQKFNGARDNYDGFGRNAADNNSLFLYAWAAY
jgi:hypothetical protein